MIPRFHIILNLTAVNGLSRHLTTARVVAQRVCASQVDCSSSDLLFECANEVLGSAEWGHFRDFDHKLRTVYGFEPYRSEWRVYDVAHRICGTVDMVYYCPSQGTYHMMDWKRSRGIEKENKYKTGAKPHFHREPSCNYYKYTVQMAVYQYIIEKHYGIRITDSRLVVLHPSNSAAIEVMVPNIQSRLIPFLQDVRPVACNTSEASPEERARKIRRLEC